MEIFIRKLHSSLSKLIEMRNEKQDEQTVMYGADLWAELNCRSEYKRLCDVYFNLADPDALRLIPKMVEVFDGEKKKIHDMTFPNIAKEEALLVELSRLRKQLGFDERERKIRHKRS